MYQLLKSLFIIYYKLCGGYHCKLILINRIKRIRGLVKGVVLDVGCGNKPYKKYFSSDISKYIGLDIINSQEVDIIGDACNLPIKSNSIDTVLCFNALNMFRNPFTFFRETNRVLKQNGYLIITTGFMFPILRKGYDRWRATEYGLKIMAEDNGFIIDKIIPLAKGFFITTILSFRYYVLSMLLGGIKILRETSNESWHIRLKKLMLTIVVLPLAFFLPIVINLFFIIGYILDKIFPCDKYVLYYLLCAYKK